MMHIKIRLMYFSETKFSQLLVDFIKTNLDDSFDTVPYSPYHNNSRSLIICFGGGEVENWKKKSKLGQ